MYWSSQEELEILICVSYNEPKHYGAENKDEKLSKHGFAPTGEKAGGIYTHNINSFLSRYSRLIYLKGT